MSNAPISIIILAAGASTRMGQSKQMLAIGEDPLLLKTTRDALATGNNVVVILGAKGQKHEALITQLPVTIIHHEHWARGMGSTIKFGITHLLDTAPNVEGVVILVCDQPMLNPAIIIALINKHHETGKPVVASRYAGTLGVPAFFSRHFFSNLLTLDDEAGAKKVFKHHPDAVAVVEFPGGEIDLDTPDDYHNFKNGV